MNRLMRLTTIATFLFSLGCAMSDINRDLKKYESQEPKLVLDGFLNGDMEAYGVVQNRSGEVVKRFRCEMKASWQGGEGLIDETFYYSDGTTGKRVWKLKKIDDSHFKGTAGDVVGEAIGGTAGNALNWKYTLDIPYNDSSIHVQMDDWMFLIANKVLINKTEMTKFGIRVGEVTLTIIKK